MAGYFVTAGDKGMIGRTEDDGATVQNVGPPNEVPAGFYDVPYFNSIDTDGGSVCCATGEYSGIWRSTNAGRNWAPIAGTYTDDNTSPRFQWIAYVGNNRWIATEFQNYTTLWLSTDNGASWSLHAHGITFNVTGPGDYPYQIAADGAGKVFARPNHEHPRGMVSDDYGDTWLESTDGPSEFTFGDHVSYVRGTVNKFVSAYNGWLSHSSTAADGDWTEVYPVTPDDGTLGPFVWGLGKIFGIDIFGHGPIMAASLGDTFTSHNYPADAGRGKDLASDGGDVVLYADSVIYRASAGLVLTAATMDTGLDIGDFQSIAWGTESAPTPTPRSWQSWL